MVGDQCYPDGIVSKPGGTDIVSRTSSDQGQTWGPLKTLAPLAGHPTATWDRTSSRTILEFNVFEKTACTSRPNCTAYTAGGKIFPRGCCPNYQITTSDGGATWDSEWTSVEPARQVAWPVRVGSGVGLQLRPTNPYRPGRIINIGWHYRQPPQTPPTLLTSFDAIFFSDDGGATWGQPAQPLQLGAPCNEAQVAELPNGSILAMMRPGAPPTGCSTCRVLSLSTDGGDTWGWGGTVGGVHAEPQLAGIPTMASIYSDGVGTYASFPNHPSNRVNGTIKVSMDNAKTWVDLAAFGGMARTFGYSCLTAMEDRRTLGLLWETNMTGCRGESCRTVFSVVSK